MRILLALSLIVALGILGYTHFVDVRPVSAEESALAELERRFESATQAMELANRSAGSTGIDARADVNSALVAVRRVENDLQAIRHRFTTSSSRRRAALLQERIGELRRGLE